MPPIGKREITSNGLVLPNARGDEQDDTNWKIVDQMISGTHPDVQLYSNKNPGSMGVRSLEVQLEFERQLSVRGAVLNGTADDGVALNEAMAAMAADVAPRSIRVLLPVARVGIGAALGGPLTVPGRINLCGLGKRNTAIEALPNFPTNTPLVQLGEGETAGVYPLAFDCRLTDLQVLCKDIAGSIGVKINNVQEGSGFQNMLVGGSKSSGIYGDNISSANYFFDELEVYPGADCQYGIQLLSQSPKIVARNMTVVGASTSSRLVEAVRLNGGLYSWQGLHIENSIDGLVLLNGAGTFNTISSSPGSTVTTLIRIKSSNNAVLQSVLKQGATNILIDETNGVTLTDPNLPFYVASGYSYGSSSVGSGVGSAGGVVGGISMNFGEYRRCNTLTENTTVSAPTNARPGQHLYFRFQQDGTGGRTVSWNSIYKGVTLPASGTANQIALIKFFYDGSVWIQEHSSGWIAP